MKNQLILAIDRAGFCEFDHLSVSLEEPRMERIYSLNPSASDAPDAGRVHLGGSVLYHPERKVWQMWYLAFEPFDGDLNFHSRVAYAESRDGIQWSKINLGVREFAGNKDNNLVEGFPDHADVISVLLDEDGVYKAPVMQVGALNRNMIMEKSLWKQCDAIDMPAFMGIAESCDGIHWQFDMPEFPVIREKLECCRLTRIQNRYILSGQQMKPWCPSDDYRRSTVFFESHDLKCWRKLPEMYTLAAPLESHIGIAELGCFGDTMVGISGRFYNAPELPDQHFDLDLAIAHNGVDWEMIAPSTPYLRRGAQGEWHGGGLLQSQGIVMSEKEWSFYFSGGNKGNCPYSQLRAGRAVLPRGRFGFAALQVGWDIGFAGIREGKLRTKFCSGVKKDSMVLLNCELPKSDGTIAAALTDADGCELSGYGFADSLPITIGGLQVPLRWRGQVGIPESFCVGLKIHGGVFRMNSPRIYAIEIGEMTV